MSEDQSGGAAPKEAGGDDSGKNDSVAYDTYRKAVTEAKRAKEQLAALQAEKEVATQSALAEQGKFKEMAEKLQKDLKAKEDESKKKDAFFIQANLRSTVSRYAKEFGAVSDDAVKQIYTVAQSEGLLNSVEVKEDYSVNDDHVKTALSELQKKSPWFFQKQAAAPRDVNMGGNSSGVSSLKDLSKLSYDDLLKLGKAAK